MISKTKMLLSAAALAAPFFVALAPVASADNPCTVDRNGHDYSASCRACEFNAHGDPAAINRCDGIQWAAPGQAPPGSPPCTKTPNGQGYNATPACGNCVLRAGGSPAAQAACWGESWRGSDYTGRAVIRSAGYAADGPACSFAQDSGHISPRCMACINAHNDGHGVQPTVCWGMAWQPGSQPGVSYRSTGWSTYADCAMDPATFNQARCQACTTRAAIARQDINRVCLGVTQLAPTDSRCDKYRGVPTQFARCNESVMAGGPPQP